MTISDCISKVGRLMPNQYQHEELVYWLSVLDGRIVREIFMTHENPTVTESDFQPYSVSEMLDTELLVPSPFDEMYVQYLMAKIAQNNNEAQKYNTFTAAFNASYCDFAASYNKSHMPLGIYHIQF